MLWDMARSRSYADLREPTAIAGRVPARTMPLWTRPLGYGLVTIVWLILFLICASVMLFVFPAVMNGTLDGQGLVHAKMFQRSDWPATLVIIALLVVPIFGTITYLLLGASFGSFLSALTLFGRSINPRYADERLSFSMWSRGETTGPASTALTGVTMSLIPVRMTRWSKIVATIYFNGFIPNANMFILGTVWGVGYFWTIAWALWPARGFLELLCAILSTAIGLTLCWIAWRRRRRFAEVMPEKLRKTPYEDSWPNAPTAERARRPRSNRPV